ncbi:MAG: nucleotide exchange factor GrpE [Clostridia bacterium]|nr:nucleotide exchange factor GrpE [Clostridia bacterium]
MAKKHKNLNEETAETPVHEEREAAQEAETPKENEKTAADEQKENAAEPETYTFTAEEFRQAKEALEKLRKEKEEAIGLLQRNQADFDNFRRRNGSVRTDSLEEGKRNCIKELLPVLDNFDRAMEAEAGDEAGAGWRDGIKLVHKQLMDTLQKLGLSEIEADGKFDPNLHNAVMQEKAEGKESGDILAVFLKGYRVGDKIIRHTMVKVAE